MCKSKKNILRMLVFILVGSLFILLPLPSKAVSRKSLINKIKASCPYGTVYKSWYANYDGKGGQEIFLLIKKNNGSGYELWFAGDKETKYLMSTYELLSGYGPCKVSKKERLFIIDSYFGGSGSTTWCYQVKSGKAKLVLNTGAGLKQKKGKEFTLIRDAFDYNFGNDGLNTGHTYKRYYLRWNGKTFKEYVGTKISQKKLKRYKGAATVLNRAKREGYKIGRIYKRGNGIININLHKKGTYGQENENLTLSIFGKKVKLVVVEPRAGSWINKYSYGGDYEKSMSLDN